MRERERGAREVEEGKEEGKERREGERRGEERGKERTREGEEEGEHKLLLYLTDENILMYSGYFSRGINFRSQLASMKNQTANKCTSTKPRVKGLIFCRTGRIARKFSLRLISVLQL